MPDASSEGIHKRRIRVFVDFWNFQLGANENQHRRVNPAWDKFPKWLAGEASNFVYNTPTDYQYEGTTVYLSYNPGTVADRKLIKWATNDLDRLPGIQVETRERRHRKAFKCPQCHQPIDKCPHCGGTTAGTIEKGIDTLIVTDMIKLAWEDAYDTAVLVSADRDFVPAVEFLQKQKGKKIIHAAYPPLGAELARKCWASVDLSANIKKIEGK